MEAYDFAKQMIDLQKTTFQNTFNALTMFQEQTEKMATAFLNQTPGLSKEGRKAINEWVSAFKKARDDFKKAVDEGFEKVEAFSSEASKVEKGKTSQASVKVEA
jgi:hypothetical protein